MNIISNSVSGTGIIIRKSNLLQRCGYEREVTDNKGEREREKEGKGEKEKLIGGGEYVYNLEKSS